MKITRLGSDKDVDMEMESIEITLNGIDYIVSDCHGDLAIHARGNDEIHIKPSFSNIIRVVGFDRGSLPS